MYPLSHIETLTVGREPRKRKVLLLIVCYENLFFQSFEISGGPETRREREWTVIQINTNRKELCRKCPHLRFFVLSGYRSAW